MCESCVYGVLPVAKRTAQPSLLLLLLMTFLINYIDSQQYPCKLVSLCVFAYRHTYTCNFDSVSRSRSFIYLSIYLYVSLSLSSFCLLLWSFYTHLYLWSSDLSFVATFFFVLFSCIGRSYKYTNTKFQIKIKRSLPLPPLKINFIYKIPFATLFI